MGSFAGIIKTRSKTDRSPANIATNSCTSAAGVPTPPDDHGDLHKYKPLTYRYYRLVSQVYVLSKGSPNVVNRLMIVRNANVGSKMNMGFRNPDGTIERRMKRETREFGYNGDVWQYDEDDGIWEYEVGWGKSCEDKEAVKSRHGAIMPWQLAYDLIRTYSRPGKLVLDVCGGTGTTVWPH